MIWLIIPLSNGQFDSFYFHIRWLHMILCHFDLFAFPPLYNLWHCPYTYRTYYQEKPSKFLSEYFHLIEDVLFLPMIRLLIMRVASSIYSVHSAKHAIFDPFVHPHQFTKLYVYNILSLPLSQISKCEIYFLLVSKALQLVSARMNTPQHHITHFFLL